MPTVVPAACFELLRRIEGEFLEMPRLVLTMEQAQRLLCLDRVTCLSALDELVRRRFLARTPRGHFVLRDPACLSL